MSFVQRSFFQRCLFLFVHPLLGSSRKSCFHSSFSLSKADILSRILILHLQGPKKYFFGASAKKKSFFLLSFTEREKTSKTLFYRKKRTTKCLRADRLLPQLEGDLQTCKQGFGTSSKISRRLFASCSSRFSRIVLTAKTCRTDSWRVCRSWDARSTSSSTTRFASCSRKRYYFTLLPVASRSSCFYLRYVGTHSGFTPSPARAREKAMFISA